MPQVNAKSHCGKSVGEAYVTYLDNRVKHLEAYASWLDKNAGTLKTRLTASTLWEAEKSMKPPAAPDLGLVTITQNACVVRHLSCPDLGCSSEVLNRMAGIPDR